MYINRHVIFDEYRFAFVDLNSIAQTIPSFQSSYVPLASTSLPFITPNTILTVLPSCNENAVQSEPNQNSANEDHISNSSHESSSSPSPSNSVSSKSIPSIQNTHTMTTRSKYGIFKPKAFVTALINGEPKNVFETLNFLIGELPWVRSIMP